MATADYIDRNDNAFVAQMQTFRTNIGSYVGPLGLNPTAVNNQATDTDYLTYVVACQQIMGNGAQQWTAWKNLLRAGGEPPATGTPAAPVFPMTPVAPVPPGVEARFRALVKQIKSNDNYNTAMGEALGIVAPEQTGPDLALVQPVLTGQLSGGHVVVGWGWQGQRAFLDLIELQVERGSGWELLAYDTTPNYTDTAPWPAAPVKWKYRAIYRVGDQRVGQWSNEVSLTVGG